MLLKLLIYRTKNNYNKTKLLMIKVLIITIKNRKLKFSKCLKHIKIYHDQPCFKVGL